ncbi:MAG: YfiR family protein [Candidatus Marinimicrobia bacterium]|nr:YfiR family protein [Candidatus Neomarinimicrobiota bacterium]
MNGNIRIILLFTALLLIFIFNLPAKGQDYTEEEIKAAYIKNISQFVTWPENKEITPEFHIVILGKDDVSRHIELFFKNISINDRPVQTQTVENLSNIKYCDILFINNIDDDQLKSILTKVKSYNALIFSDTKGFAEKGTHINFFLENQKVKFEINLSRAIEDGFFIQSLLLDYAKIIKKSDEN